MSNNTLKDHLISLINGSNAGTVRLFVPQISYIHEMISDDEAQAIGNRVHECRINYPLGAMTQTQLAQKAGINKSVVSRIEKGDKKSISYNIDKISDALGVPVTELVLNERPPINLEIAMFNVAGEVERAKYYTTIMQEALSSIEETPDLIESLRKIKLLISQANDELFKVSPITASKLDNK